ncbi:MAG: hypothetical protein ACXWUG_10445 [Polyangiales bacterium]
MWLLGSCHRPSVAAVEDSGADASQPDTTPITATCPSTVAGLLAVRGTQCMPSLRCTYDAPAPNNVLFGGKATYECDLNLLYWREQSHQLPLKPAKGCPPQVPTSGAACTVESGGCTYAKPSQYCFCETMRASAPGEEEVVVSVWSCFDKPAGCPDDIVLVGSACVAADERCFRWRNREYADSSFVCSDGVVYYSGLRVKT